MSVPVLMYHHILSQDSFIASSVKNFDAQMKYLNENGWKSLTSNEFYLYKQGKLKVPKKSLLITFDDGWRDNFIYAYPILKKYNLKATLFVVTQWIEKSSNDIESEYIEKKHNECKKLVQINPRAVLCTWSELKSMKDVFDIHSHTHTHYDEYFGKTSLKEEMTKSQELIRTQLGFEDTQLCWPRGKYSHKSIEIAVNAKFDIMYTTKRGINLPDNNLLEIKRIAVKKDDKWLKKNLFIYSNKFIGKIYSWIKPE
ncbi:polysaccharide deacetylase family protein [Arcobacter sp. KX21116]|uniref:polysaccharide deacetylase family protein n=1 Tax=Arcobacter iocasae TaxID=2906515 RepID=UPI0035D429CF